MARVKTINKPSDYPYTEPYTEPRTESSTDLSADPKSLGQTNQQALGALFAYLFPDNPKPCIDESHAGIAISAHNPTLALQLAKLSRFIALELPWCERQGLRELAILTVNVYFNSEYSYERVALPPLQQVLAESNKQPYPIGRRARYLTTSKN